MWGIYNWWEGLPFFFRGGSGEKSLKPHVHLAHMSASRGEWDILLTDHLKHYAWSDRTPMTLFWAPKWRSCMAVQWPIMQGVSQWGCIDVVPDPAAGCGPAGCVPPRHSLVAAARCWLLYPAPLGCVLVGNFGRVGVFTAAFIGWFMGRPWIRYFPLIKMGLLLLWGEAGWNIWVILPGCQAVARLWVWYVILISLGMAS